MEKEIINMFTKDEIEILKTVLLERSTFYTRKIVDTRVLQLKTDNKEMVDGLNIEVSYNYRIKNAIDKLFIILSQEKGE